MIFLLIMILTIIVVSSFILGHNVNVLSKYLSDNAWLEAMHKTLDDCNKEIDSDRRSEDWADGAIWIFHSLIGNLNAKQKNKKEVE